MAIVVSEHVIPKNSVCYLRRIEKIHLEQPSLLGCLIRPIIFQSIKKECCGLLDHILGKEYVNDAIDIDEATALFIGKLIRKLGAFFGTQSDDVLKKSRIIRRISRLFGIRNDLVKLTRLGKAGDNLNSAGLQKKNTLWGIFARK